MTVVGANLAATFMKLGLIDDYRLYIFPIMFGSGKPMFPQLRDKIDLKLVETRTFGSRVVMLKLENKPA